MATAAHDERQGSDEDGNRTRMSTTRMSTLKSVSIPTDPAAARRSESEEQASVLDVLVILTARRRLILKAMAVCTGASLVLAFALPQRYTAKTTIMPPQQQNSSIATALTSQLSNLNGLASLAGGSLGLKTPNDMYVAMLHSQAVEDAMIDRYGLMKEYHCKYIAQARKVFERRFDVEGNGKDSLIHISVEDKDPERAAQMANDYVDQFRKLSQGLAITEAAQRRAFFETQLEQSKDKLADAEEALKQTEQSTGMLQLDSQARALIESAAILRGQIEAKEVQIQMMRTYAGDQNANLIEAEQGLEGMRAQLAKLGGAEDDDTAGLIQPKGVISQAGLEYVRRLRDVKYYETIFEILARQFELAKLDEAKEGAIIQTVDPAVVPDHRSFPPRLWIVIAGVFLGLLVGSFLALTMAGIERMQQDPEADAKLEFLRRSFSLKRPRGATRP
jgi:tyrosine-protein kinase Etk/Wzc